MVTYRVSVHHPAPGTVRVDLGGDLDLTAVPSIRDALGGALRTGAERVEVNLAAATLLDCSVIGVLVAARRDAGATGADLALYEACHPTVRTVLRLAGVMRLVAGATA